MKTKDFQLLTAELERMTPHQRRLLADCLHKIGHIPAVSTLIESRILATPLCPKCAAITKLHAGDRLLGYNATAAVPAASPSIH